LLCIIFRHVYSLFYLYTIKTITLNMHSIIMHDFYSVCLYVSAFGLSDLFVRVYKITSVKHLFYYYLSILCIAILSLYLF